MKAKILFVVNVDWFFVSHRLPIAIAAKEAGYEVHVACQLTDKADVLTSAGFVLHELKLQRSGTSISAELKTFISIWKLISKLKPSLIHMITIKPVLYAGIVSRFYSVARVASISGLGFVFIAEGFKAKLLRFFISLLYRFALKNSATKVIFQNNTDKQLFISQKIIEESATVTIRGSGVDLNSYRISDEPEGLPVFLLLARLLIDKGVLEFVEAARLLKAKGVGCRMVLVGDTDENPKSVTKQQINSWVSDGLVEYWGYTNDVNSTYANCHVAVLPSYREGLPKSLIEAAACGRAVITTDVPGCRDAIVPDETGLLVQVKKPEQLAAAIEKLCVESQLRRQLGKNGRRLAEAEFDVSNVVGIHLKLYYELLGS